MKNGKEYVLVDVPGSLTPSSFKGLKLCSPSPVSQPRNMPEPKKKGSQWPQTEDLRKLHERYGELVEKTLKAVQEDCVMEWCSPRLEKMEDKDIEDIRQWQEMFKVMNSFGQQSQEMTVIELSEGKLSLRGVMLT